MLRFRTQCHRLTIGQFMIAVAVCVIGLMSPKILVFAFGLIFWWIAIFGAIYSRIGRRIAEWCTLVVIILVLLALTRPAAVTTAVVAALQLRPTRRPADRARLEGSR